jgi:hypothetical protein
VKPQEQKDKEGDKTDKDVEQEHDVEQIDETTDIKGKQTTRTAVDGVLKNKIGTDSAGKPTGVYSRLWKSVTDYKLSPVRYTTVAWYVPNAMPYRPLIESCCKLVGQSSHAMKHEKEFNPYAFATGMYYLESIQILRAQKAAGELVGQDLSALARFEKYNALESIMIPEPFIPLLESLAAVELEDVKYHWIVPQHRLTFTNATTFADVCTPNANGIDVFRPNIPFMLANLATFGATTRGNLAARIDAARVFTPIDLKPVNNANPPVIQPVRFLGGNRTYDGNMANANDIRNVVQMCGADHPFQFWNDNYYEAHLGLRNSRFFVNNGIDIGLTNAVLHPESGNALNDGAKVFNNLDAYLFIAKSNNPSWFQYLSEQINIVARFFPNSRPMSKIAVTGGMEPTVLCHLKLEDSVNYGGADHYIYENAQLGRTNYNQLDFYQNRFRSLTAAFTTTRGDIERNEELNAFALGICANPPIATAIAAQDAFRGGRFFSDAHGGAEFMRAQRLGFTESTIPGDVPMYNGWHDDFVKPAFSKTPTNA